MHNSGTIRGIELLAPARDCATGMIAVDAGADAVYIGGPAFGARVAAGNETKDIAALVEYSHMFGVRVYAALNTIVYENELKDAEKIARELISAGVDALIVQDMAFLRMGLSGVELHASTQMSNCTPEKVEFLREAGFSRVILERGLTFAEISEIAKVEGIDIECFVHGAICVGLSGQCYMSRSMSRRSGNRGDCSQPCRLTYDLLDGNGNTVIRGKHLLSVLDLNLSERIPQLLDAGVTSFKIEGRLKDANYVRNVVSYYRMAIDKALKERQGMSRSSSGRSIYDFTPDPSRSFTRGFTTWMLDGKKAGQASFSTPKATGEYIGKVTATGRDSFTISGNTPLNPGDGICFISNGELIGTNVNRAEGQTVWPNKTEHIVPGTAIYRNYDHAFNSRLNRSRTRRVIGIKADCHITHGILGLTLTDEDGNSVCVTENLDPEPAKDPGKMENTIRSQLSKLGDSIFATNTIDITVDGELPFIPVSKINAIRRRATELLIAERLRIRPEQASAIENLNFPYPSTELGGEANITNSLAERFYRYHGVTKIAAPLDLMQTLTGQQVMTSAYCLRRELGQCLKQKHTLQGPLRIKRGAITWLLEFDCTLCRMNIIKE